MFRRLECFLAVARLRSFSGAARYLFLSQSAVSQQISALERDLGFLLFERGNGPVDLTPAGAYLYPRMLALKEAYEGNIRKARTLALGSGEGLSVGFDGPIAEPWIGRAIALANGTEACGPISMQRASLGALTERLIDDAVDVIVTTDIEMRAVEAATFVPLRRRGPCIFCAPEHALAQAGSVSLEQLRGEHLMGAYNISHGKDLSSTGEELVRAGLPAGELASFYDGDTAFLAVQANMGVFVASHLCDEFAKRYGVVAVDLDADLPDVTLGLAYRRETPAVLAFVKAAKAALNSTMLRENSHVT